MIPGYLESVTVSVRRFYCQSHLTSKSPMNFHNTLYIIKSNSGVKPDPEYFINKTITSFVSYRASLVTGRVKNSIYDRSVG